MSTHCSLDITNESGDTVLYNLAKVVTSSSSKLSISTGSSASTKDSKLELNNDGINFTMGRSDSTHGINFKNSDGKTVFKISSDNIQDTTSTTGKCPLYIDCTTTSGSTSGQIYRYMANGGNNNSGSWVTQNGRKFFIDDQNRMYRLLLRQDMEKDLAGNAQASAGWPNNTLISATKQYNNNSDPETAHQFLDFGLSTAEWDEYRDVNNKLEFKKVWPGIETRFPYDVSRPINFEDSSGNVVDWMTWKQTSEPGQGVDFEQIDEDNNIVYYNANSNVVDSRFDGIDLSTSTNRFLDGNGGTMWFYAAGIFDTYGTGINSNMGGLTAMPIMFMSDGNWIYHTRVEVWVRVPTKVYLVAGQSNSVGFGVEAQLPSYIPAGSTVTNTKYWGNGYSAWTDMTAGNTNASQYFGYELPLGYLTSPSYILKYASGGTNLHTQWDPDGSSNTVYTNWLTTVTNGLNAITVPYQVVGMAWMQGESDASNGPAQNYETNLTEFIAAIRTVVGFPKMRFGIGKIYVPNGNATYVNIVRAAQDAVATADDDVYTIETNDLSLHDSIHYDGTALITMAERFITGFGRITSTPVPIVSFVTQTDSINSAINWHKLLSQDLLRDINTDAVISSTTWPLSVSQNGFLNKENPSYANYANFNDGFVYVQNVNGNYVFKIQWGDDVNNWEYIEQSSLPTAIRPNNYIDPVPGFVPTRIHSNTNSRNEGIALSNQSQTWLDTDAGGSWWGGLGANALFNSKIPAIGGVISLPLGRQDQVGSNITVTKLSLWMATTGIATANNQPTITLLDYDVSGRWWKKLVSQNVLKDVSTDVPSSAAAPWDARIVVGHMWNTDKPRYGNYINLNIDYTKHVGIHGTTSNAHYQFRINYPGSGDNVIFNQTNKPLEAVSGFVLQEITGGGTGAGLTGVGPEVYHAAWLSGNSTSLSDNWYTIGRFQLYNGITIPGVQDLTRQVNENSFWILTEIRSSTEVFGIGTSGGHITYSWHNATPVGEYTSENIPLTLTLSYDSNNYEFNTKYLSRNTTVSTYMDMKRHSSLGNEHSQSGEFYMEVTNTKNTYTKAAILNNYICVIFVIEVIDELDNNIVIENFIKSRNNAGVETLENSSNRVQIDNGYTPSGYSPGSSSDMLKYELKNRITIPASFDVGNDVGYIFGLSITGGTINTSYFRIIGFRIEID